MAGYVGMQRDVTLDIEREKALRKAHDELEERVEDRDPEPNAAHH